MLFSKFQSLLVLIPCALASTIAYPPSYCTQKRAARTIFQFKEAGVSLENIAVRPNGDLLVTMLAPNASLLTVKKPYSATPEVSLLYTFENQTGLLGITETKHDEFAFISVQNNSTTGPVSTAAIWQVTFSREGGVEVEEAANITGVLLPNGLTSIKGSSAVLVADSFAGDITRCNLHSGSCEVVLSNAQTASVTDAAGTFGVNGVHYSKGYLFFSNSNQGAIFKTRVDRDGYPIANSTVATVGVLNNTFVDDFADDGLGTIFAATNINNTVVSLQSDGLSEVVAGSLSEFTVAGSASLAFGRTKRDSGVLYVITSAGFATVNGTAAPAQIVALDIY
ncbi:hypothetical protein GGS21DRAFT_489212 [Xylaria nigripes]|nr:hypothetical protein GGS21DRAFT_489212 [Xylaria nigripes]